MHDSNEIKQIFLTRSEAALYLRVSVGHLDNLIRKGEIAVTRIGCRVLLKKDILNQWVDEQTGIQFY